METKNKSIESPNAIEISHEVMASSGVPDVGFLLGWNSIVIQRLQRRSGLFDGRTPRPYGRSDLELPAPERPAPWALNALTLTPVPKRSPLKCKTDARGEKRRSDPVLVEQPGADRSLQGADIGEDALTIRRRSVGVQHHIANIVAGLVILRRDIDGMAG